MAKPGKWDSVGELFIELDRAGKSAAQIASELGVSDRFVQRWRRRLGLSKDFRSRHSQSDRDLARQLVEDGCPRAEVARTVGASVDTIDRWFPDATWWTRAETLQFARDIKSSRSVGGSGLTNPKRGTNP